MKRINDLCDLGPAMILASSNPAMAMPSEATHTPRPVPTLTANLVDSDGDGVDLAVGRCRWRDAGVPFYCFEQ